MIMYFINGEYYYSFSDKHANIHELLSVVMHRIRRSPIEICRIKTLEGSKTIYYHLN
jgi:hypothetical protein